jgi:hypothetical protein
VEEDQDQQLGEIMGLHQHLVPLLQLAEEEVVVDRDLQVKQDPEDLVEEDKVDHQLLTLVEQEMTLQCHHLKETQEVLPQLDQITLLAVAVVLVVQEEQELQVDQLQQVPEE